MNDIIEKLDIMVPNPKCELNYKKDYELLIATMLSAQTTDKMVNKVTENLFVYSLYDISVMDIQKIESIIKVLGTYTKKAYYTKEIAKSLLENYNGSVPCNRVYLESLPGVGRKTTNLVLAYLYNKPLIAVDTHVLRTTKILGIIKDEYSPKKVEEILNRKISENQRSKVGSQLVLFGRYICKAKKPDCNKCLFNGQCIKTKKKNKNRNYVKFLFY